MTAVSGCRFLVVTLVGLTVRTVGLRFLGRDMISTLCGCLEGPSSTGGNSATPCCLTSSPIHRIGVRRDASSFGLAAGRDPSPLEHVLPVAQESAWLMSLTFFHSCKARCLWPSR